MSLIAAARRAASAQARSQTRKETNKRRLSGTAESWQRLNIYKDAARAPKPQPDESYPAWLWTLLQVPATKAELERVAQRLYARGGFDAVFADMPHRDIARLLSLHRRDTILASNARRRGGRVV